MLVPAKGLTDNSKGNKVFKITKNYHNQFSIGEDAFYQFRIVRKPFGRRQRDLKKPIKFKCLKGSKDIFLIIAYT